MKTILSALVFTVSLTAQGTALLPAPAVRISEPLGETTTGRALYRWSVAAVIAANTADAASSWRKPEANAIVAGRGQDFGGSSLAIKAGFVVASLVLQRVTLRHRPDLHKRLTWINFATAGMLGGVARWNASVP